ncbi:MAG TPA: hypothetical protein VLI07_17365 [Candidatus Binatus sp.]|jgi:hypothetical protein|nr:hypothetical protein [Candidatus Binatus sp.]
MRKLVVGLTVAALVLGRGIPSQAQPHSGGEEAGLAISATVLNVLYLPAKIVVAIPGFILGGLAGFTTGGDTRAAYALWVPTLSGTWLLRPANIEGSEPIQFFGTEYADTPSSQPSRSDGGVVYDGLYKSK